MKELTIAATVGNMDAATAFVLAQLEALDCPMKAQTQISIAIDELLGNIVRYAYGSGAGEATVRVEATEEPRSVIITFIDSGAPYDPLAADEPDTTLPAEERAIGGLGIFMVKKLMDEVAYRHEDGRNILSIRKMLRAAGDARAHGAR